MTDKEQTFTVSDAWLKAYSTPRGGYTMRQLQVLGVPWPPQPGWKLRVAGREISAAERQAFERAALAAKGAA